MKDITHKIDDVEYSFAQGSARPYEIILFKDNVSVGRVPIETAFRILKIIAIDKIR